jgi:hypothetical protein
MLVRTVLRDLETAGGWVDFPWMLGKYGKGLSRKSREAFERRASRVFALFWFERLLRRAIEGEVGSRVGK